MVGLLGTGLEVRPAGFLRHPEDVLGPVFVRVLGVGALVFALARNELGAVFLEGVGDVLEEDQAEDDVLVFRRVHVVAELVGGEPELGLETRGWHPCRWRRICREPWVSSFLKILRHARPATYAPSR